MAVYYNEFDPGAAAWLRELIKAGCLPAGEVDERDIREVQGEPAVEQHYFAGIGGWPLALRLAGWPAGRPVWTGSAPCQPFSAAGKRKGTADERHLWPEFLRLIAECRPATVFGEQVASGDGRKWLAGVRADLEALGYAVGAADLCAAGVGSPHIRQRLFWVAHCEGERHRTLPVAGSDSASQAAGRLLVAGGHGTASGLADANGRLSGDGRVQPGGEHGRQPQDGGAGGVEHSEGDGREQRRAGADGRGTTGGRGVNGLGHADDAGPQGRLGGRDRPDERTARASGVAGFWDAFDILPCRDGKARRIPSRNAEPGALGMADGLPAELAAVWFEIAGGYPLTKGKVPGRVGMLRGYGNAIVPAAAAAFVRAFLEYERCRS